MQAILQFNHTTQNWTTVTSNNSPFYMINSGCALISNQVHRGGSGLIFGGLGWLQLPTSGLGFFELETK
jgi:hypothetical protein